MIKGISTYCPDKGVKLATYASKCIENEILMHFRSLRKSAGDLSLSETIDMEGDDNNLSLLDIISQDEDIIEKVSLMETCANLHTYIEQDLTAREADIIRKRYGLNGAAPLTQREVAAACGISRSYVSRIEKKALEKLRDALGQV